MHYPDTLRIHTPSSKLLHVMILHLKALYEYCGQLFLMVGYGIAPGMPTSTAHSKWTPHISNGHRTFQNGRHPFQMGAIHFKWTPYISNGQHTFQICLLFSNGYHTLQMNIIHLKWAPYISNGHHTFQLCPIHVRCTPHISNGHRTFQIDSIHFI